jgi:hypothetical protein
MKAIRPCSPLLAPEELGYLEGAVRTANENDACGVKMTLSA